MKRYILLLLLLFFFLFSDDDFQKLDKDIALFKSEKIISDIEIKEKILEIADVINMEYKGKEVTIILIMKGSFIFVADLVRELKIPLKIETVRCSSYGKRGIYNGELKIDGLDNLDIEGKDVILVDDIFDTGKTLDSMIFQIKLKNPKSLKSLVLILKEAKRRLKNIKLPDYYLFKIPDKFIIGYGMDYKEYFREKKSIYSISELFK